MPGRGKGRSLIWTKSEDAVLAKLLRIADPIPPGLSRALAQSWGRSMRSVEARRQLIRSGRAKRSEHRQWTLAEETAIRERIRDYWPDRVPPGTWDDLAHYLGRSRQAVAQRAMEVRRQLRGEPRTAREPVR